MFEKHVRGKSRAGGNQPEQTEDVKLVSQDSVTHDVLNLQRQVGNHRVLQVIAQNPSLIHQPNRPLVQRAETGIRTTSSTNHFTKAIFDYCNATANHTKTIAEFKTFLADSVNVELKGAGAAQLSIVNGAPGASGEFDFATWAIELNENDAFPGATTVGDLTDDQISEVANTVYHESRHSEQWFRIARNRAGKALNQNASAQDRQTAATTIANDMGIPVNIALEACNRPLYSSWGSRFGGGTDKKVEEAEAWEASIYGVNSDYRNEIVLGDFNDDVEQLDTLLEEANDLYPPNFDTLDAKAQKPIIKAARSKVKQAKPIKDRIEAAIPALIQPEIDRLTAIVNKTAVDTTMLNHLQVVKTKFKSIKANFRGSLPNKLAIAAQAAEEMKDEMYQAYLDLPEEADAWPAGDAVTTQYNALVSSAGVPV